MFYSCLRVLSLFTKVTFIIHIDLNEFHNEEKATGHGTLEYCNFSVTMLLVVVQSIILMHIT